MERRLLKLFHLFDNILNASGINISQMHTILKAKLAIDKRRYTSEGETGKLLTTNINHILYTYTILGILTSYVLYNQSSFFISMLIFYSYLMFMMALAIITDLSIIIFDSSDNFILLPKPINDKTYFAARLFQVMIYILQFTIALCVAPIIMIFFKYGLIVGLLFIYTSIAGVVIASATVYGFYIVATNIIGKRRIRIAMPRLQIIIMLLLVAVYRLFPAFINLSASFDTIYLETYSYFLPPVWLAASLDAFMKNSFDGIHIGMMLLTVIVPGLFSWILLRYLSTGFRKKLLFISHGSALINKKVYKGKVLFSCVSYRLSKLFCHIQTERAAFQLVWRLCDREKTFKLQFFPSLFYMVGFAIFFTVKGNYGVVRSLNDLSHTSNYLWLIYLPMLGISNSLFVVRYSEFHLSSWIFYGLPVSNPGVLIVATVKALFIKYFMVAYIFIISFCIYVWGFVIFNQLLLGFCNALLCFLFFAQFSSRFLPFSKAPNTIDQMGKLVLILLQLLIIVLVDGLHSEIKDMPLIIYSLLPVVIGCCYFLMKRISGLTWIRYRS